MTHYAYECHEDDHGKGEEGDEGVGIDVRMSVLKELHHEEATNDEHEGSVCTRREGKEEVSMPSLCPYIPTPSTITIEYTLSIQYGVLNIKHQALSMEY